MSNIPNRRGHSSPPQNSPLPPGVNPAFTDDSSGFLAALELQQTHHRHTLDHSYYPPGNEDKNHGVRFPRIPTEDVRFADRLYADPYRRSVYIVDRNGKEMFFTDEENGLISPARPRLNGQFCLNS